MFKKLKNIETTFQQIRLYAIIFAVFCLLVVGFTIASAWRFAEQQREKIYVLDQGKSLMLALSQDTKANRPVEAREHVRRFHELFFTLAPDGKAIEGNINRAFKLADESAYKYYNDLAESHYYRRLIANNASQVIFIDSIVGDFTRHPYRMVTYAKQQVLRRSNVTERNLITVGYLRNTARSDDNPQGFLFEDFRVVANEDIKTTDRNR